MREREGCLCMLGVVGMERESVGGCISGVAYFLFQYRLLLSFERVQSPQYDWVRLSKDHCYG